MAANRTNDFKSIEVVKHKEWIAFQFHKDEAEIPVASTIKQAANWIEGGSSKFVVTHCAIGFNGEASFMYVKDTKTVTCKSVKEIRKVMARVGKMKASFFDEAPEPKIKKV